MYCYQGSCTNTAGDAQVGWKVECLSGSTVQTIYSDAGTTQLASNRAVTDSTGNFYFYVVDGTYTLKYYNAAGVLQRQSLPITMVGMDTVVVATSAANSATASASAAAASAATAAAYTSAKTANTAALISSINANALFPQPSYRLPAADVATIVDGAGFANSAINGATTSAPAIGRNDTKLTWPCGALKASGFSSSCYVNRGAYAAVAGYTAVEFVHTGTTFEVLHSGGGANVSNFRLIVNGREGGSTLVNNTSGQLHYTKITFPSSATRTIRIETSGVPIGGINVASTSEVAAVGSSYPLVTLIGDSFNEGTGASIFQVTGEAHVMARALGWNAAHAPFGGTGLLLAGGATNWQDSQRLTDLTLSGITDPRNAAAYVPAAGCVMTTMNDQGVATGWPSGSANFQQAVQRAVFIQIDAWIAARSGKPLFFFGPTYPSDVPPLDVYRIRDAVQEAVNAAGGPRGNFWFIDRLEPGTRLRKGLPTVSTDQADLYTDPDNVHPNQAGHNLDGLWMAARLREIILTQLA